MRRGVGLRLRDRVTSFGFFGRACEPFRLRRLLFRGRPRCLCGTGRLADHRARRAAASGTFSYNQPLDAFAGTGSYGIYLQAGRDWRLPSGIVLGIVGDAQAMSLVEGRVTQTLASGEQARIAEDVAVLGTVRGRAGVVQNGWLWYGTAGWAWTWSDYARDQLVGSAPGGTATAGSSELHNTFRSGYVVGAGVEMPVAARWNANLEYLFTSFGKTSALLPEGAQRITSDLDLHTLRAGLTYRFGADDLGTTASLPKPPKSDTWSVHAQTTTCTSLRPTSRRPIAAPTALCRGRRGRRGTRRSTSASVRGRTRKSGSIRRSTRASASLARSALPGSQVVKPTSSAASIPMRGYIAASSGRRSTSRAKARRWRPVPTSWRAPCARTAWC